MMGHLNSFSASGVGNLNKNFPKIQMPGGVAREGMFNPLTPVPAVTGRAKTHPQFPVPAVTGREKACQDNCLSYPP